MPELARMGRSTKDSIMSLGAGGNIYEWENITFHYFVRWRKEVFSNREGEVGTMDFTK